MSCPSPSEVDRLKMIQPIPSENEQSLRFGDNEVGQNYFQKSFPKSWTHLSKDSIDDIDFLMPAFHSLQRPLKDNGWLDRQRFDSSFRNLVPVKLFLVPSVGLPSSADI